MNLFLVFLPGTKKMTMKAWYWSWKKSLSTISTLRWKASIVINLIKRNVCVISIDLKDEFFLVFILNDYQNYLKFMFGNLFDIWEAKVITLLHTKFIHISKEMRISLALLTILGTVNLLRELGFVIHSYRLLLTPS